MNYPKRWLQLQSDCNDKDLPEFKPLTSVKFKREYLKGWFGCDDCPVEDCQVYDSRAPVGFKFSLGKKR